MKSPNCGTLYLGSTLDTILLDLFYFKKCLCYSLQVNMAEENFRAVELIKTRGSRLGTEKDTTYPLGWSGSLKGVPQFPGQNLCK